MTQRAFIRHRQGTGEWSVNFAVAEQGLRDLGWEIVPYLSLSEALPELSREDMLVDYVDPMLRALSHLGVSMPQLPTYPEPLQAFLGRRVWESRINYIAGHPELWPVFVKPQNDIKKFTGVLVRSPRDLIACGDPEYNTPVWCSEPVQFIREWRAFYLDGSILDVRPYKGDWRISFDPAVLEAASTAWPEMPRGCALDFGVDASGRTLMIEANEGFSLGAYGLPPVDYARLLVARWSELVGAKE